MRPRASSGGGPIRCFQETANCSESETTGRLPARYLSLPSAAAQKCALLDEASKMIAGCKVA